MSRIGGVVLSFSQSMIVCKSTSRRSATSGAYVLSLLAWTGIAGGIGKLDGFVHFVGAALVLSVFIVFGVTLHLLLSGSVDWIMFARYRRDHRAFLNRYNRL